jgi:hypothetical protein
MEVRNFRVKISLLQTGRKRALLHRPKVGLHWQQSFEHRPPVLGESCPDDFEPGEEHRTKLGLDWSLQQFLLITTRAGGLFSIKLSHPFSLTRSVLSMIGTKRLMICVSFPAFSHPNSFPSGLSTNTYSCCCCHHP